MEKDIIVECVESNSEIKNYGFRESVGKKHRGYLIRTNPETALILALAILDDQGLGWLPYIPGESEPDTEGWYLVTLAHPKFTHTTTDRVYYRPYGFSISQDYLDGTYVSAFMPLPAPYIPPEAK